ncbi:LysR family transcriptional regulator [Paraneptunicella aestuarii]|uniref:LysR family transcriptional regulator n=1 Tax=Paraneptunicella aestuarii TaxID=2831148 RepID=UPI001E54D3EC|nr:LysR family transcriptional regulator [Paraneptunicella aestuarii]UAA39483.1 LysR family transcriptional regulator [Paraneptunicella aestuarii]
MLERYHLSILQSVVKTGTVTEAAEELHLTQSALSHAIKKLENQLGMKVWEKQGRTLKLTQAGKLILSLANRINPQFEQAELLLSQIAKGQRGLLRIGMECHPCYQWLLKVVEPFLKKWPDVEMDVKQEFQFGGMGALRGYEIDLLVTPDPLFKPGVDFIPVFDYEHQLVVARDHPLADKPHVQPHDLINETLITYPVEPSRLDIFSRFLVPAGCTVKKHKIIETTEIMLQMVAANRGVAALPGWLIRDYAKQMNIQGIRFGEEGIHKQIFLGIRNEDRQVDYINDFIQMAGLELLA